MPALLSLSNNIPDAKTPTYQFPHMRQEYSEDPLVDGAPDIPIKIELTNAVAVPDLSNAIPLSSTPSRREQDARELLIPQPLPASNTHSNTFQHNRQEALPPVDPHHNIVGSPAKIEHAESMPHSLSMSTAIQQLAAGGDPRILRVSISQHQPSLETSPRIDIPSINPRKQGSPARPNPPLNEDVVDFLRSDSREERVRYNVRQTVHAF